MKIRFPKVIGTKINCQDWFWYILWHGHIHSLVPTLHKINLWPRRGLPLQRCECTYTAVITNSCRHFFSRPFLVQQVGPPVFRASNSRENSEPLPESWPAMQPRKHATHCPGHQPDNIFDFSTQLKRQFATSFLGEEKCPEASLWRCRPHAVSWSRHPTVTWKYLYLNLLQIYTFWSSQCDTQRSLHYTSWCRHTVWNEKGMQTLKSCVWEIISLVCFFFAEDFHSLQRFCPPSSPVLFPTSLPLALNPIS